MTDGGAAINVVSAGTAAITLHALWTDTLPHMTSFSIRGVTADLGTRGTPTTPAIPGNITLTVSQGTGININELLMDVSSGGNVIGVTDPFTSVPTFAQASTVAIWGVGTANITWGPQFIAILLEDGSGNLTYHVIEFTIIP